MENGYVVVTIGHVELINERSGTAQPWQTDFLTEPEESFTLLSVLQLAMHLLSAVGLLQHCMCKICVRGLFFLLWWAHFTPSLSRKTRYYRRERLLAVQFRMWAEECKAVAQSRLLCEVKADARDDRIVSP